MKGRHYFMSLTSGKIIIRNKWTILPMPAKVIATIHQLTAACKKYKGIVFTDKDGNIVNYDSNDDYNNTLEITGVDTMNNDTNNDTLEITGVSDNTPDNTLEITGVSDNMEDTETATETEVDNNEHNIAPNTDSELNDTGHNQDENYEQYNDDISIEDKVLEDIHITVNDMNTIHEMNARQLYVDPDTGEAMEEEVDMLTHGYNLWPRPTKRNQKYNMVSIGQQSTIAKLHLHVMLNQVGIREGLKRFREKGNNALLKELNQLHERDALLPKKKEDMMHDERKRALRYLMFLKEKRAGTIKARGCADGRSQRKYTTKAETSSPTVSLEAMMMACAIDSREGRHVAVTDIPGTFLYTDMEEDVHMLLEGTIAEIQVYTENTYGKISKGNRCYM